jgi:hypothetical protein
MWAITACYAFFAEKSLDHQTDRRRFVGSRVPQRLGGRVPGVRRQALQIGLIRSPRQPGRADPGNGSQEGVPMFALRLFLAALLVTATAFSNARGDTFSIDNTAPNVWPAEISFTAPCGINTFGSNDPSTWYPPSTLDGVAANNPSTLCADKMRTLTDPFAVWVTSIGAVNPDYTKLPNGAPLPSVGGSGPQDPQNAPTPIIESSVNGSMAFLVPVTFQDTTNTSYDGEADGVLEAPFDATECPSPNPPDPNALPTDPATGLRTSSTVPFTCMISTPGDYLYRLQEGHTVKWAQISSASFIVYGPQDLSVEPSPPYSQRQPQGGQVQGKLRIPYMTDKNSTVLRIGVRYSIGYKGQIPITWGNWPTPYVCSEQSRRDDTCTVPSNGWAGMQTAWIFSQPFTVQVQPISLIQFHFLPVTLVYNPPGNQSSASISTSETTTQSYLVGQNLTIIDQVDYDQKTKSDLAFKPSANLDKVYGVSGNFITSTTWDDSARYQTGAAYAQMVSSATSYGTSATYLTPKNDSSAPDIAHLSFQTEPFWSDYIVVAVNPQFAVWAYPDPRGQNPEGQNLLQAMGSSTIMSLSTRQLLNCFPAPFNPADKGGLSIPYDTLGPNNLTKHKIYSLSFEECAQLFALDRFFVGRSQATPPPTSIGVSVPPGVRSLTTAIREDKLTYITTTSNASTWNNTIKSTITSAMQNSLTSGQSVQYSTYPIPVVSTTIDTTQNTTTTNSMSNEVDVSLGVTESTQTQQSLTATIDLADCALSNGKSNCNLPVPTYPSVEVFQDTRFGTLMAVLPGLNIPPPSSSIKTVAHAIPDYLTNLGIGPNLLLLPHTTQVTRPLSIIHGPPYAGGPRGPGPVTETGGRLGSAILAAPSVNVRATQGSIAH